MASYLSSPPFTWYDNGGHYQPRCILPSIAIKTNFVLIFEGAQMNLLFHAVIMWWIAILFILFKAGHSSYGLPVSWQRGLVLQVFCAFLLLLVFRVLGRHGRRFLFPNLDPDLSRHGPPTKICWRWNFLPSFILFSSWWKHPFGSSDKAERA